jgi:predicted ATPase
MKVKLNNGLYNLEAGYSVDFSEALRINGVLPIVGENATGKSTLLRCIRGLCGKDDSGLEVSSFHIYKKMAEDSGIEVNHDYDNIFFFDGIHDDKNYMSNNMTAPDLMRSAFFNKKRSHGESSIVNMFEIKEKIKDVKESKNLLIIDEIDRGLSLDNMVYFSNFIKGILATEKFHVIIVSHNPFFIADKSLIFDMKTNKFVSGLEYIELRTGYTLKKVI